MKDYFYGDECLTEQELIKRAAQHKRKGIESSLIAIAEELKKAKKEEK